MSLTRFFCPTISSKCRLNGSEAHHITNVMRMKVGDTVELFDGKGTLATAEITSARKREVLLKPTGTKFEEPRHQSRIILVVSLAKDQRFDWLMAKATELGVDHICPAVYHRTVKQGSGKDIVQRYEKIAVASAKQCKRLHLPTIEHTRSLDNNLKMLTRKYNNPELIIASLAEDSQCVFNTPIITSKSDKIIFIGPEGGFTDEEEQMLRSYGATSIRLTETILRIETAAIAMSSIFCIARDSA